MKNNLIEQEITRIKEILYNDGVNETTINESTEVISEQLFPTIEKYLGKVFATKMETNLGDDVMKNLEVLFQKGSTNFMKNSANEIVILTKSGTQVPMKTVKAALNAVTDGKMTADDVAKLLPKQLKDGTDFATIFKSELKKAKPKTIAPKPAAPKPSASNTVTNTTTATTAKSFKDRLADLMKRKKQTTATSGRYLPTEDDFLDVKNLIISGYPELSERAVLKTMDQVRKIVSAKSKKDFDSLADTAITTMADLLNKPKEQVKNKLFRLIRTNPRIAIAILVISAPTITAMAGKKVISQFNKFVREFIPSINSVLDAVGVPDPRVKSSSGQFTNDEDGIVKFLTMSYPTKDINNFTINRDSDTSYSVTYTENGGTSKPIIFNYRNGTFSK